MQVELTHGGVNQASGTRVATSAARTRACRLMLTGRPSLASCDGASYALTLGIANGLLFSHILAFSPRFTLPELRQDSPKVFLSHGTDDRVLPIQRCSRVIVPQLRRAGLDVTYREFEGLHTLPLEIANKVVAWFLQ